MSSKPTSYKIGRSHRTPPKVLKGRDIPSLAKYIKSEKCENIVFMLGAGVSTSAGIPDFRSPGTGLYSNLQRLNLPRPEAVFEIGFFRRNPVPFYTLAHELYPGKFRPTLTHSFIRLLHEKGLLYICFTQNIDTLERRAGVPGDKIIEAHGSFATQRCIDCKRPFDDAKMKEHILDKKIAHCEKCNGYIKPDIVFFGESLPPEFINSIPKIYSADLLIVMGTSLTVHPFATLAELTPDSCPRVLINLDQVGDFGSHPDDLTLLGSCDEVIQELCKELGWEDELLKLWDETAETVVTEGGKGGKAGKRNKGKPYVPDEGPWENDSEEDDPGEVDNETDEESRESKPDVLKDLEESLANLAVDDKESPNKSNTDSDSIDKKTDVESEGSSATNVLEIPTDPSKTTTTPSTTK